MNTRQNYGQKRAESTPVEPTALTNGLLHLPLVIVQATTSTGDLIPSEVELVQDALMHYRSFLADTFAGSPMIKANLETLDELIEDVRARCFRVLTEQFDLINELTERRA